MYYPAKSEFSKYAEKGNLVPVYCELTADMETAVSAFRKLAYDQNGVAKNYAFLLESVENGEQIGRFSFLGIEPRSVVIDRKGEAILTHKGTTEVLTEGKNIFAKVRNYLQRYKLVEVDGLAPFSGGAVGFAGFEVIQEIEPSVHCPEKDEFDSPDAVFMIVDTLLAFDHVKKRIQVISHAFVDESDSTDAAYEYAVEKIDKLVAELQVHLPTSHLVLPTEIPPLEFSSNKTVDEFHQMVETGKRYIYDGDIIQVVLSQRFEVDLAVSPVTVHRALRMVNPSPYMFCLHLDGFALVGSSPEIHARSQHGKMTVRPIAGTRKRGATVEKDLAMEKELLADEKERAEHIMLVDLGRNDLGRIAKTGSVQVPELMVIERYSHVMHIVSDVTGELDEGRTTDEVMSATFPAGTLSGAPKIRAMQVISELENERRGPYGGTVTYFSFDGNVDSCITIRTVMLKDGKAYVQAGAGVVADSVPELEYKETVNKAKGMMTALSLANYLQ